MIAWASFRKHLFAIGMEHCPHCGGTLKVIAAMEDTAHSSQVFTTLQFLLNQFQLGLRYLEHLLRDGLRLPYVDNTPTDGIGRESIYTGKA